MILLTVENVQKITLKITNMKMANNQTTATLHYYYVIIILHNIKTIDTLMKSLHLKDSF